MGYGASSKISTSKFWELTEKLPVTIEILDETTKIENFYKLIEPELLDMPKRMSCYTRANNNQIIKIGEVTIKI